MTARNKKEPMHLQQNDHKVWLYFGHTIKFGFVTDNRDTKETKSPMS